jgi:2-polyprenyl-6-methoxyphenol hydroxylase-like FAD-dependent oxidoreductase
MSAQIKPELDTDVLIVGAGPTGLMLANQLARRGVRVLIIDRHSGPAQQTRAIGVQARTLEIYAQLGVIDQALELGLRTEGANLWANGQRQARIPVGDIGKSLSRFPYILMLGQDDNERILGNKLNEHGVAVQWNTELVTMTQLAEHVAVTLKQADGGVRESTAAWVGGCDGSHSTVRELCGIDFPGEPYEQVFFVADAVATGEMIPNELNIYLWEQGFHLFFPMHGENHWRVIGILPLALRERTDLSFDEVGTHVSNTAGITVTFTQCEWFSTYRIAHRSAARFREQRCFLLGDAAHVHSPMGAQGMNTGLQDAYNLAWKLSAVVKGEADVELLESYAEERMPVAQQLLKTTDRLFMGVVADTWIARLLRTKIIARVASVAMRRPRIQRLLFRTISQIGIRYRHSSLSSNLPGLPASAPQAGERFPWARLRLDDAGAMQDLFAAFDDTRFTLLVIGSVTAHDVIKALGERINTLSVHLDSDNRQALAAAGIAYPSGYLLRPDGHVALAGVRLDVKTIEDYFFEHHLSGVVNK